MKSILLRAIGDRSNQTFTLIWSVTKRWHSFWYVRLTRCDEKFIRKY
ncbi:MAG: hypothetical protein AAFQ14_16900 [Cyanobacteria bacterium J06621_12]